MRVPDATQTVKPKAGDAAEPKATNATSSSASADIEQEAEAVEKFTVDELRAGARRLFGVSKHVVAGALSLEKQAEWSIEEAERKVKDFLSREVPQSEHAQAQGRTV